MRGVLLSVAFASMMTMMAPAKSMASAPAASAISAATAPMLALQVPDKTIEITVGDRGGGRWYRSPVWIAIGVLGVIVVLLLIVMAARGGGTTIVRD